MKRRRGSRLTETGTVSPFITNLPSAVFVEILLRLPVSSIVMCKSVCKSWYGLVSAPEFTKLHSAGAKSCALIRGVGGTKFLRSLYFLQPEARSGLDSGYCECVSRDYKCPLCRFNVKVKFKLKIPLRNVQAMLDAVDDHDSDDAMFCLHHSRKRENSILLEGRNSEYYYDIVNSSNGFICLAGKGASLTSLCVCNPVTGEFAYLPRGSIRGQRFGFGFSPRHNRYKVIRMRCERRAGLGRSCAVAVEMHTLGTDSWRSLDISGSEIPIMFSPSYLNGALYWTYSDRNDNHLVASFDLDDERFRIHSTPLLPRRGRQASSTCLETVVLDGRLYAYTTSWNAPMDIWAVEECGMSLSWTRMFSIDFGEINSSHGSANYQLVCFLNDDAVVLFGDCRYEFIYYDRSQGFRFKHPMFRGLKSRFKVMAFTPSFISLREAAMPSSDIEILNVNSRCGKIKLLEETYPLSLGKAKY